MEQGGEERDQLCQLIGEICPPSIEGFWAFDIDRIVIDMNKQYPFGDGGITSGKITLIEKKIKDAEYKIAQKTFFELVSKIMEKGIEALNNEGCNLEYNGFHLIRVPDNVDWEKWKYMLLNDWDIIEPVQIKDLLMAGRNL